VNSLGAAIIVSFCLFEMQNLLRYAFVFALLLLSRPAISIEPVKKCEIQFYPRSCSVQEAGGDFAITVYLQGSIQDTYQLKRVAPNVFKDKSGMTWKASRVGASTVFKSWQCPPRESCGAFALQIWD
jgi:hypothetical protein